MSETPRRALPNPFYVLLLLVSTLFVITALMYCVSPMIVQQAIDHPNAPPRPGSRALVDWLDRNGPMALGVEIVIMMVTGLVAMATDRWFAAASKRKRADNRESFTSEGP